MPKDDKCKTCGKSRSEHLIDTSQVATLGLRYLCGLEYPFKLYEAQVPPAKGTA